MALVSTSIPNLLNGVSQQPSPLRQVTQGETQINALSSVIDGLIKRPPTEHLQKILTGFTNTASAIHLVDRGENNRHIIVVNATVSTSSMYVFDLDGNALTTTGGTNNPYLFCSNPARDLAFLTVADYTFVLNKTKMVANTVDTVPGTLITSKKYQGFEDLPVETATHHVGDGNTNRFATGFNFHDRTDFSVTVNGADITFPSGYILEDDYKTVRLVSTPPQHATIVFKLTPTVGDIFEVIGDEDNAFDSFYVKSVSESAYEETARPSQIYKLDYSTMPHAITPNVPGYPTSFALTTNTWLDREVGDTDSAPHPSFVNNRISNLFFYKNRLGFLSNENVIFSGAGDFFRFYPKTVTTILDDGPIDVSVSHTKVSLLKHAIPFNESLTLFAESTQFTIQNVGNLTPKTISIIPSTDFENDTDVAPVGTGNLLYFASKKGDYSSVREYYIEADTVMSSALDITAHVPKYIPKNLTKLATSSNEDVLFGLSSDDRSKLFVYKWFTDGTQKLQSSWSTWQFTSDTQILDLEILESTVYMAVKRSNDLFLEKIDLQYLDDTNLDFCVRADRKVSLTGAYDSASNVTTFSLPYGYSGDMHVVKGGFWVGKGSDITSTRPSDTTVQVNGDFSGAPVILGVPYDMTYEFSTQHVRELQGTQSVQSGRLQLRTMRINYENTGYFKVEVTPLARPTFEYEFTGVVLNKVGSIIGSVSLDDGTYRFPIQSKNDRVSIKLVSDSYLPCAFQNAEWEGFYNIRSKRI